MVEYKGKNSSPKKWSMLASQVEPMKNAVELLRGIWAGGGPGLNTTSILPVSPPASNAWFDGIFFVFDSPWPYLEEGGVGGARAGGGGGG